MAETNQFANVGNLPPEIFQQQQELNRQQRMADMLMQNNQQPQGQMIGNRFVAPSWAAQLAPVVNNMAGAYLAKKGDEQAAKIAQNLRDYKTMENQAVSEAVKAKDWNKVLDLAAQSYTGAGKEYVPSAIAAINPKPTELKQNYQDWLESGGKGTLLDYQRYVANLNNHPSFTPFESGGMMYTMNSRTGQAMPMLDSSGQHLAAKNAEPQKFKDTRFTLNQLGDATKDYLNDLKNTDIRTLNPLSQKATDLQTKFTNVQMQIKGLYELGAITGPDLKLLNQAITNPNSFIGRLKGGETLEGQVKIMDDIIKRSEKNLYKSYDLPIPARLQDNVKVPTNPAAPNTPTTPLVFTSEADAAKAGLKDGTPVVINGVSGTWKH